MIQPPWFAKTYGQAILLRILHEVGHIVNQDLGDLRPEDVGRVQSVKNFTDALKGNEGAAWKFAFVFRHEHMEEFLKLSFICSEWSDTYN